MGVRVDMQVAGIPAMNRKLALTASRMVNSTPAFALISTQMDAIAAAQFATEGAYASGGWAPLSPVTIARRAALGYGPDPILQMTRSFMDGLTNAGSSDHISVPMPDSLHWGSTKPWGNFHMTGTSKMPARPPFKMRPLDRVTIVATLRRYALTGIQDGPNAGLA